jgi:hypothetical protein
MKPLWIFKEREIFRDNSFFYPFCKQPCNVREILFNPSETMKIWEFYKNGSSVISTNRIRSIEFVRRNLVIRVRDLSARKCRIRRPIRSRRMGSPLRSDVRDDKDAFIYQELYQSGRDLNLSASAFFMSLYFPGSRFSRVKGPIWVRLKDLILILKK